MKIKLPDVSALRAAHNDEDVSYYDPHKMEPDARKFHEETRQAVLGLLNACEREGRDLTASEQRSVHEAEALMSELETIAHDHFVDRRGVVAPDYNFFDRSPGEYREGKPLTREQSVEGYIRSRGLVRQDEDRLDLRKYLRGLATGDWQNADAERRAMAEGAAASGGYLVPTVLSAQIVDMVRNQTRVIQAGATVVPMENRTLDVAKWTGDPTAAWHTENAVIAPSDATIGKVTLTAQALAANVEVSWELLEDAPGVEDRLREAFAAQFALKLDMAALYGSGTAPEPRGVKNTAGVTQTVLAANGAALTSYDPLIDSVGRLQDQNEQPTGIIYSGRTARGLSKLKDTTNQPLAVPEYISDVPRYATNQIPNTLTTGTSNATSDIFTADWRQLLIGVRTQLQIAVLRERYADNGQTGFVAWWRGDVAAARVKAFDVVTGVL